MTIEGAAAALVGWHTTRTTIEAVDLLVVAGVVVVGLGHHEVARGLERRRRHVGEAAPHVDLTATWIVAGALLVPAPLAAAAASVVLTYGWLRSRRSAVPPYRHLFSTATVVLACVAAAATLEGAGGWQGEVPVMSVLLAIMVYAAFDGALVRGVAAVGGLPVSSEAFIGEWGDPLTDLATLCLGGLIATITMRTPYLLVLALVPLLVLHRAIWAKQLQREARRDPKTGLLTMRAWTERAEAELDHPRRDDGVPRPVGVLVLDLDHFKTVNDRYGHLVGDLVLREVAAVLRDDLTEDDVLGRFGGEEFVVLVVRRTAAAGLLVDVAERLRKLIGLIEVKVSADPGTSTVVRVSVTTSIGGTDACHDESLTELLERADRSLLQAKRAGRNRVLVV